jgi:YesN/AraC family two-component response regulator
MTKEPEATKVMENKQDLERAIFSGLSHSKIYLDYQKAFQKATGLPLTLRAAGSKAAPEARSGTGNPFCSMMNRADSACQACLELQKQLKKEAKLQPKTLKCFAGLCETALPIRVGENLIAYLRTGEVFVDQPSRKQFNRLASTLLSWGAQIDVRRMEEHYFNTRLLSKSQYDSMIELLKVFAQHLAECGDRMALEKTSQEPDAVAKARKFIQEHHGDELSLHQVAQTVNVSANYFSEMFKKTTGLNFSNYVARVRIEKTKHLLGNTKLRISEIAFEAGFQSLSQFNRAFKKITGKSPSKFRASAGLISMHP